MPTYTQNKSLLQGNSFIEAVLFENLMLNSQYKLTRGSGQIIYEKPFIIWQ